jgi:hypothetical protein
MFMIESEFSKSPRESDCVVIRDEREFCSYIETRLREEGLELVETSPIAGWGHCLSAGAF